MTSKEQVIPPTRLRASSRNITELSRELEKEIESAPLKDNTGQKDESDKEGGDLLSGNPKYSAEEFIQKKSDVDEIFSENAPRKSPFMLYLNHFEKAAICLVMQAYGIDSMNDLIREYGIYRAVDVAIEKLGFTEKDCEQFYKNNKDTDFAKKRNRTKRKSQS